MNGEYSKVGDSTMTENKNIHIYVCPDQIEGIFTAIYDAWASGYGHAYNRIQVEPIDNYELFSEYITVQIDKEKSVKVSNSIKKKIGNDAYTGVYDMAISTRRDKGDIIYRFLQLGFHLGPKVMNYLSNDYVNAIFKTMKTIANERHHYVEFIRFAELSNGILFSQIRPKNNVLTIVAPHFADRLQQENWMIVDEGREIAVVHPAHKPWFLVSLSLIDPALIAEHSEKEDVMVQAFSTFIESIAIKERTNYNLQRNMLPLRFREYMPEFKKEKKNESTGDYVEYEDIQGVSELPGKLT